MKLSNIVVIYSLFGFEIRYFARRAERNNVILKNFRIVHVQHRTVPAYPRKCLTHNH
jgi:hypothetical protein